MNDSVSIAEIIDAERKANRYGSLTYLSWVSVEHKFLYMSIPKNACTTVKMVLNRLAGRPDPESVGEIHGSQVAQHLADFSTAEIVEIIRSPEWFKFCFVRNPYDRLFSAYKSKIGIWGEEYGWLQNDIRKEYGYPLPEDTAPYKSIVAFRDFVRYVQHFGAERRDREGREVRHESHWNVQTNILMPAAIKYDFVGRFERFVEDFQQVLVRLRAPSEMVAQAEEIYNPTMHMHHAYVYDRELADVVFEMYRSDFEQYGYERDSWMFDANSPYLGQKGNPLWSPKTVS